MSLLACRDDRSLLTVKDEVEVPHQLLSRIQHWTEEAPVDDLFVLDEIIEEASLGDLPAMTPYRLQVLGNLAYVALELLQFLSTKQRQIVAVTTN